ncbi:Pol polyprotein, partial [Mucuna pruriens]
MSRNAIDARDSPKGIRHLPNAYTQSRPHILGPFPIAPGKIKFLIVAVDYFTKWVEAEPKKVICRFGIPTEIVSDNGTQFASRATTEFCEGLRIKQIFTSVEHPQSIGQAEAANKVLWSYHTTPHSTTNETPFRLTFGTKAVLPLEIGESSARTTLFEQSKNEDELRANLDLLQEVRETAHIREYAIKERVARTFNKRVVPGNFRPQDLVLRRVVQKAENKLTPS